MPTATAHPPFAQMCRRWRQRRRLSQLDLALAADVSQRHVSWLETGRSSPSREMVVRLAEALSVPLRERNRLLGAAGFAPLYRESGLDEAAMRPVLDALNRVLDHHEPLPAVVVDRAWNVIRHNRAAAQLFSLGGDIGALLERIGSETFNLALLTLHPLGLRPFIRNWDEVAPSFVRRLQQEALMAGDEALASQFAGYAELAGPIDEGRLHGADVLLPLLPLDIAAGEHTLSLFSIISTFGTPQDITTDELRIETFYPADAATRAFFEATAGD